VASLRAAWRAHHERRVGRPVRERALEHAQRPPQPRCEPRRRGPVGMNLRTRAAGASRQEEMTRRRRPGESATSQCRIQPDMSNNRNVRSARTSTQQARYAARCSLPVMAEGNRRLPTIIVVKKHGR
jgi:hypothetical protein